MPFALVFQPEAERKLRELEHDEDKKDLKKLKKVRKCIGMIETNPQYPGLQSHKYGEMTGRNGKDVWESYVENNVSMAWRVFWHYGPGKGTITIVTVTAHP